MPEEYRLSHPASAEKSLSRKALGSLGALAVDDEYIAVGRSSTEFAVLSEQRDGQWRYAVRAVDVAGNLAPWAFIDLLLTPPDNYYLLDHLDDILPGSTLTNALGFDGVMTMIDPAAPKQILPYNTAQTWQSHFTANGFATPQAQVTAGLPLYALPPATSSTITWEHDYVDAIPQVRLTIRPFFAEMFGTPVVTGQVLTKLNPGDAYAVAFTGMQGVVPQNARFVKLIVTITSGIDGLGMMLLDSVGFTLDVHYVTDQGVDVITTTAGPVGTHVDFHVEFLHVVAVQLTPASTAIAYCQFVLDPDPPGGMTLFGFTHAGAPVPSGQISWTVRGY